MSEREADTAALGRALLACVDDRRSPTAPAMLGSLSDDDLARLAFHALRHRVVPYLYLALQSAGLADTTEAMASLWRTHAVRAGEHLRILADLDGVAQALDAADVPFLVIKGPAIAERLYPSPDLRVYDDLDLVVPPSAFERTIDALEGAGFGLLDRNWDLIRNERRGQLHLRLQLGTLADVHWHLLNREIVRGAFDVSTEELFERRRTVTLLGREIATLDATDTLLHLCVHAALSGCDRLIWLKDVERAIAVEPTAWDEVVSRARGWRAGSAAAITLSRAARAVGAAVPDSVIGALSPSGARRAIERGVDARWPVERATGEVTPAVLWAQVAREGWSPTVRTLVGRAGRRSRTLLRQEGQGEAPIFREAGDEGDGRAYLRDVTRTPEPDPPEPRAPRP